MLCKTNQSVHYVIKIILKILFKLDRGFASKMLEAYLQGIYFYCADNSRISNNLVICRKYFGIYAI